MLDNNNNVIPVETASSVSSDELSSKFDVLLSSCSVRTKNVLSLLRWESGTTEDFLDVFLKMSRKDVCSLKNCGAKTVGEILNIQSILSFGREDQRTNNQGPIPRDLPANIDTLLPLVMSRLEELSVRAKNGFISFLEDNHKSLSKVYKTITAKKFNPVKMKNVGRKTANEVKELLGNIREFIESFPDEQSVEEAVTQFYTKSLNDLRIPAEAQEGIHEQESVLGHFPLFAAINAYFEGLDGEERAIINGLFIIHEGQSPRDRDEVAAELGLSSERVRQKRNTLVNIISNYFATYHTLGFVDKCPYNYQMCRIHEEINSQEGTNFNLNFVNWVLASVFDEVTLFGDIVKTITGRNSNNLFLCLVPTDLCQYFDFNAFINDIQARLTEKRINEEKINLRNLIDSHLKTQFCEDEMPAIEIACRSILFLHFPVEVDFGQVIFKPNARKNNPIIVEEILRAAGHPMTLEEIYDEFIYQYPERYTEMNSFRGNISNNPNIIPIGRSSTYTLAEWESDEHRGGSIRGIVADFLSQQEPTIASVPAIVEYVCKFRPSTDEKNILSNLSLERNGTFSFFYRNGERYIGLSSGEYPREFFPTESSAKTASANSIWYPKVLAFIDGNGRFPSSSGADDEEKQLYRFWLKQERLYANGELDFHAGALLERIASNYGHISSNKIGISWEQFYERVKNAFETKDFSEMDDDTGKWLARSLREYQYHKDSMPDSKRESIEHIISFISGNEQCTR